MFCPGCGVAATLKLDKYKRPYWRCFMCGLSLFLRTDAAEAGFWLIQSIIRKNPKAYRAAVLRIATQEIARRRLAPTKTERAAATV